MLLLHLLLLRVPHRVRGGRGELRRLLLKLKPAALWWCRRHARGAVLKPAALWRRHAGGTGAVHHGLLLLLLLSVGLLQLQLLLVRLLLLVRRREHFAWSPG